jgi:hypothetical protein
MPSLFDIRLGRGVDLRAGIGRDPVAAGAEQAMDRQARFLAGDVPQCDVDGADRADRRDAGAPPEQAIEALAVERVLAHHQRLQEADQARPVEACWVRRSTEEGVALDPLIGREPQQAEIALPGRARGMVAVNRRRDALPGEQGQGDVGDLHISLPGINRGGHKIAIAPGPSSVNIAPCSFNLSLREA